MKWKKEKIYSIAHNSAVDPPLTQEPDQVAVCIPLNTTADTLSIFGELRQHCTADNKLERSVFGRLYG